MDSILVFMMLWGVWLITPILVDGVDAISRLVIVKRNPPAEDDRLDDDRLPAVTVIVPAHNEAAVIDRCLTSVKAQDYPHDKLEVIVIDDGSTDDTATIAEAHAHGSGTARDLIIRGERIAVGPFQGRFLVIRNGHAGKAHALNTGIDASTGELIINIDSDVMLAPLTVRRTAEAFVLDETLGAATGDIEIDWDMLEERDAEGHTVVGDDGLPVPRDTTLWERVLAKSQFLEYLASFRLGRQAQAAVGTMYTLAGAYSAIRRTALESCRAYSNRTVSEDTDLTWMLHRCGERIGFVRGARVFLEPCTNWDELYAQRVRWARGQLEVSALNNDMLQGQRDPQLRAGLARQDAPARPHAWRFPACCGRPCSCSSRCSAIPWRSSASRSSACTSSTWASRRSTRSRSSRSPRRTRATASSAPAGPCSHCRRTASSCTTSASRASSLRLPRTSSGRCPGT